MSGIEVIAGVFAAVSSLVTIFKHGHSLYRDWKAAKESEDLSQSLTTGGRQVQQEYDAHFMRIGSRFASGDGTYVILNVVTDNVEIAVSELKDVIIVMQSQLIAVLQASIRSEGGGVIRLFRRNRTTDHSRLADISDTARRDSIRALAALSQRLSAPVPCSISEPVGNTPSTRPADFFCKGARRLQANRFLSGDKVSKTTSKARHVVLCNYCCGIHWLEGQLIVDGITWKMNLRFMQKSHLPMLGPWRNYVDFGCTFCESQERFESRARLISHLEEFHTCSEFKEDCDLVILQT
jgi:hypothetical protein